MIRINLVPGEELDNPLWYVPDLVILLLFAVGSYFAVQKYFDAMRAQIVDINTSRASLQEGYDKLAPDLARFKHLQEDQKALNSKVAALKAITVTKIAKYKPIIVMEHLQNLKPEGVWFSSLRMPDERTFEISGLALDNILVAEFVTTMKATQSQEVEASDLRTQVFFSDVTLLQANLGVDQEAQEIGDVAQFSLRGTYDERGAAPEAATLTSGLNVQLPGSARF